MSLSALIGTHDEAALAALASVGLVRRAGRDLEAGKAEVARRDEVSAEVAADGQTVTLGEAGLAAAHCTCPATGICRHIVLAVLALREGGGDGEAREAVEIGSARDELAALSEADVRTFAGADWDKAITQARISTEATLAEEGANLSVRLPDTDFPVVFLAGLGLAGAVYKGPKTTKRRVVTAAALVARMQGGTQGLDDLTHDAPGAETMAPETLDAVRHAIEATVGAVFAGGSVIAEERLFDLSISARAQAAPRLTALLRLLVRHARQAREHHFSYGDDRFLADAAFAYALTMALGARPDDPALTGVIRRHYAARDPFDLVMLGAVSWQAGGGARGARFHGFSLTDKAWFSMGQARAAGMDPSFSPRAVYDAPLWGANRAKETIGHTLALSEARVSSDDQIAWEGASAKPVSDAPGPIAAMEAADALFTDWIAARADMRARLPMGLAGTGRSVPVLIRPSDLGETVFDDIAQVYRLPALDARGARLDLTIPASRSEDAGWLRRNASAVRAILCEASVAELGLRIEPVTVYIATGLGASAEVQAVNLTFDTANQRASGGTAAMGGRALSFLKPGFLSATPAGPGHDPVTALAERCFEAVAETMRFGASEALGKLEGDAETLGLGTLARALTALEESPDARRALRVSYLAAEVLKAV